MSSCYQPLIPAVLVHDTRGRPVSTHFNDVYYAGATPLAQARHTFLAGNQLPGRWQGRAGFTVLETGFGLGHNFLALWDAWRHDPRRCARLHVVSIEAHPFTHPDLARAYQQLDTPVQALAHQLVQAWPVLTPGVHRLEFDHGAVTLTLAFGPIERMARHLELGFDACFLDGFSPRVNPEMWTPEVFRQLARMANADATLATWCSAGQVRRDLQSAGFLIERRSGFGNKRHSITGRLRPGMGRAAAAPAAVRVAIVGGGFAGAATAYALAQRGQASIVFDPALAVGAVGTHRGHRGGALTPAQSRDDDIRTRLSRAGVLLAGQRWQSLGADARPLRCGAFEPMSRSEQQGWRQALDHLRMPHDYIRWMDPAAATESTGLHQAMPGLWHEYGHLVRPEPLLAALLGSPLTSSRAEVVDRLARNDNGEWLLYNGRDELMARADWVVIANSWLAARLLATLPDFEIPRRLRSLHRVAGQLSYFPVGGRGAPKSLIVGHGLCMPDGHGGLIGGSTYVTGTTLSIMTAQGHHENREKVTALLSDKSLQLGWPRQLADGWAGWRAAVRDRIPVIGPIAQTDGLWLACGFGSRGLTWSALAAELLAARLNHEPIPLERGLLKKIAPV